MHEGQPLQVKKCTWTRRLSLDKLSYSKRRAMRISAQSPHHASYHTSHYIVFTALAPSNAQGSDYFKRRAWPRGAKILRDHHCSHVFNAMIRVVSHIRLAALSPRGPIIKPHHRHILRLDFALVVSLSSSRFMQTFGIWKQRRMRVGAHHGRSGASGQENMC